VARLRIAYIGGGSTRGAGTMASFVEQGENFSGSEIVLIDLDAERLELIRRLSQRMAAAKGIDLTVSATTDRRAGLEDCDAILTSYRPGGFEARVLDERIPLSHGVIGQETQGPGGFFMALRSIHVMRGILDDVAVACPGVRIFNYTNPVNVVAQAVTDHSDVSFVSLCEGPIVYPEMIAEAAGLDPARLDVASVGLNHGSWSVRHRYDGRELLPLIEEAYARRAADPSLTPTARRMLRLATVMGALPSEYFQYYYFEDEVLRELTSKPTTRAEDILSWVPGYWEHYVEQAGSDSPELDPARSRGGIHELELAIDCMDAVFNDRGETLPVNVPNQGSIPGFSDTLVVETLGRCDARGVEPLPMPGLPAHLRGLVEALGEYQQAAADAAWSGDARDAVRALAAHPLVRSVDLAEQLYAEMAAAHRAHLPARLLPA
jgi:6-phospho-beta-glucosidase